MLWRGGRGITRVLRVPSCRSARPRCTARDLEGVQQAVDGADQLLPLGAKGLLALDVGLLLHFARNQALRLLARAAYHLLHLAVQLLHLAHLGRAMMVHVTAAF